MSGTVGSTANKSDETTKFRDKWGSYGYDPNNLNATRLSNTMEGLVGTSPTSAYTDPLQSAILNPNYSPNTASEEALLNQLSSLAQGTSAARGLGPATPSGLADSLAPTLIGLRQQNIGNLQTALGEDISSQLQNKGIDMNALNELIQSSMGNVVQSGGYGSGKSSGGSLTAKGAMASKSGQSAIGG